MVQGSGLRDGFGGILKVVCVSLNKIALDPCSQKPSKPLQSSCNPIASPASASLGNDGATYLYNM